MGKQAKAAVISVATNYLIGVPLEIVLAFKVGMGVSGLYTGYAAVHVIVFIAFLMIILRQDWQQVTDAA